jgi:hypothetical protein
MSRTTEEKRVSEVDFVDAEIMPSERAVVVPKPDEGLHGSRAVISYLVLPLIFLAVTLLGGFRFGAVDNAFLFLKPPLVCLVYAAIILVLFVRSGLIQIDGWLSEGFPMLRNLASCLCLLTLFAATVQVFNSVMPEQGLPFWVVAFFFFWTLWNNLFADFDARRLLRSVGAMFALAFVAKYLVLANLAAAPTESSWLQRIFENPGKEALTWVLDLPRYSSGTGYVQFFTVALFLLGLYLTPRRLPND